MPYLELFERVADHVRRQGVKVQFKRGGQLDAEDIAWAQTRSLIPIPDSLAQFYAEVGDGMSFRWSAEGERTPFTNLEFPKLSACTVESLREFEGRIEWSDDYDFRFTDDPSLAKQTALGMRQWMPFHDEGNGDRICLDTASEPAPVVFDQHDWFDGGSGENGHILAPSLLEFYQQWSEVCFQFPSGLWWPSVFNKIGGGVNWQSNEFREPFRLWDVRSN